MRIGIIGSSGGSAFAEMHRIAQSVEPGRHSFHVVTDRLCGLERYCVEWNLDHTRIEARENGAFSLQACDCLKRWGIDFVLMFFSRLVTKELFHVFPTLNIHPALLPAFPGLGAVKQAKAAGAKFLGATLHVADALVDHGALIAQIVMPIRPDDSIERLEKYSFIQKVYLSVLLVELAQTGILTFVKEGGSFFLPKLAATASTRGCNPAIQSTALLQGVLDVQEREQVRVIA